MAKVGAALELLLRKSLEAICEASNLDPHRYFENRRRGAAVLYRATAGEMARALKMAARDAKHRDALTRDLERRNSVLWKTIKLRNVAAHEAEMPSDTLLTFSELRELLDTFLRE